VGLLAFAGGLLVTSATKSNGEGLQLPDWFRVRLFYVAVLALLTLLFDVLQYTFSYKSGVQTREKLRHKIEELKKENASLDAGSVEVGYDRGSLWYRGITLCFWLKLGILIYATTWLTIASYVFLRNMK
jgi:hypothetical protein